jgi:hypothetical protein
MMLRSLTAVLCVGSTLVAAQDQSSPGYPNKLIRIITAEAGGGNERAAGDRREPGGRQRCDFDADRVQGGA